MAKCYFELRKQSARGTDSIAADIMRHLHARQHLGKALIICDQPTGLLAASRRQWLKMGRAIQKQRASTLNADKILKFTYTITRMQHLHFSSKGPLEEPEADIHFLTPEQCTTIPIHCYTVYIQTDIDNDSAAAAVSQLPAEALVVDYNHETHWARLGLQSKVVLEQQVASEWEHVITFLTGRHIRIAELMQDNLQNVEAMDNALDTLLNAPHQFLRVANEFHHALEIARPLRVSRGARQQYDMLMLLAYRVQALSPGAFTQHFLESYNEDDTFFLYDRHKRRFTASDETLAEAVARHMAANRPHLAWALRITFA
jgi:hypothetical protein